MFLTIRNLCIDFIRNKKETTEFNDMLSSIPEESIEDYLGILIERVCDESKRWHTYDRNLFEFYMYSGLSYRDISNGTDKKARLISNNKELKEDPVKSGSNISVNSIYTTINICKNKLRDSLSEDFEDYFKHFIKDTFEDEIADAFIRLLDIAGNRDVDILENRGYLYTIVQMEFQSMMKKDL